MTEGTKTGPLRIENLAEVLEEKLENEAQVLEVLVMAQSRGNPHPELWDKLHAAAMRDDRLSELAFAYEKLAQDRRVRIMPAPHQAQVFLHAARYFLIGLGDVDGSQGALERALSLVPGHPEAFEQLSRILEDKGDRDKLANLHLSLVGPKTERDVALEHLRKALAVLPEDDEERALKVAQQILKLDPSDAQALGAVEARLASAGKYAELVKLLEQAVAAEGAPDEARTEVRRRIVALYDQHLPDIDKAIPHVEEVLAADPHDEAAHRLANRLLGQKPVAARAAAALERVYDAQGDLSGVAEMLGLQIDQLRGPKRAEAQRRQGMILADLGDNAGAYASFEAVLGAEPGDDEVRARYLGLARELGKQADAVKLLSRSAGAVKDATSRARVNLELGRLLAETGDLKRARTLLSGVVEQAPDDGIALEAARALRELLESAGEPKPFAQVLEALARLEPDAAERVAVLRGLAALYEQDLADMPAAIEARRRIVTLDPSEDPSELERLLSEAGQFEVLAQTLEARATALGDAPEGREVLLRAARIRMDSGDEVGAAETFLRLVREHGPSRGVHGMLLPLLDAQARHDALVEILRSELELAGESERVELLARLGGSLAALGRDAEALAAFGEVLATDPTEARSRTAVEAMLARGEHRLQAAEILAPIYRSEGELAALVAALEVRAELAGDPGERMDALAEALEHVTEIGKDRIKALFLAGKGLREATAHDAERIVEWTERIVEQTERGPSKAAVAETMGAALRERAVDHPAVAHLARRTGEAFAACGDANKALDALRRALDFDADDDATVDRIDQLLESKGAHAERVELARASLAREATSDARKAHLFRLVGAVQEGPLGDLAGAIDTYRAGLAELGDVLVLEDALLDALAAAARHDEVYEILERRRARADELDPDARASLEVRLAQVAARGSKKAEAVVHYTTALASGGRIEGPALDAAEALGAELADADLLVAIAERRVDLAAGDAPAEIVARVRLGQLLADQKSDPVGAAGVLKRAAELAVESEDALRATALYRRVIELVPGDRDALSALAGVFRSTEDLPALLGVVSSLVDSATDADEAASLAIDVAGRATEEHVDAVVRLTRAVDARFGARVDVGAARAGALSQAGRQTEAAEALSALLASTSGSPEAVEALDAFLAERADDATLHPQRRALFEHRRDAAEGDARRAVTLDWARFESDVALDRQRAASLYDALLEADPDDDEARGGRLAVAIAVGDHAAAARCLRERLERTSGGDERVAASIDLAELCARPLGRMAEALDVIEVVLDEAAGDARVRAILLEALADADLAERAAAMLTRVAEATPDLSERAGVYRALFDSPGSVALGEARQGLFDAWIECLEGQPAEALQVAVRAAREFPEDDAQWDRAETLAREASSPAPVGEAYRAVLGDAQRIDPEAVLRVGERGVSFFEEWFDDEEAVTGMLRLVVEVAPTATWAFERLKLVYNAGERWTELFALYDVVIAAQADDEERILLLEDAAEVARDLAGDADRGIDYLERLRVLRPRDARIETTLERLYERHERTESLVRLLEDRTARLSGDEERATRLRIAGLYAESLGRIEPAFGVVQTLIEGGDDEAVALADGWLAATAPRVEAGASYERLAGPAAHPHAEAATRQRIAASRRKVHAAANDQEGVARCLLVALEADLEPATRRELLDELAMVYEIELGDPSRGLDARLAALAADPADEDCLAAAEEASASSEELARRLADALVAIGERETRTELAVSRMRRASAIARETLGDDTFAIGIDLRILSRSDQDPAAARVAARQLDKTLLAAGREAERCDVLERLAKLEDDAQARRAALVEAARIAEEVLKDGRRAARALSQWLAESPDDPPILDALVRNVRTFDDQKALVDALELRAVHLVRGPAQRADHLEIARLHAAPGGDSAAAVSAYKRAIDVHGPSDDAVDELATVYEARDDHAALVALLEGEATRITDRSRRAALLTRLGEAHLGQTAGARAGEEPLALDAFVRALGAVPTRESAQVGLEKVVGRLDPSDPAARPLFARGVASLASAYRIGERSDRLLALVPARIAVADSAEAKADVWLEAAELEQARDDLAAMLARTLDAFDVAPLHGGVAELLLERARRTRAWDRVASHLLPTLETESGISNATARALAFEAASAIFDDETAGELVEALLVCALARAPGDVEVLRKLVDVRRRRPDRLLVDALVELSRLSGGDVEALREATTVALRSMDDADLALVTGSELWSVVVAALGASPPAEPELEDAAVWCADVLSTLHKDAERPAEVLSLLLGAARLPIDTTYTTRYLFEAADLALPPQAAELLGELHRRDPKDDGVAERLDALYRELDLRQERAELLAQRASVAEDPEHRAGFRLARADVLDELRETDAAVATLRESLAELPTHERTVARLARLLDAAARNTELVTLLEDQASRCKAENPARATELWDRASELADQRLGDPARAARSLARVVELSPRLPALDRYATLLERTGRHAEEAEVLERVAAERGMDEPTALRLASAHGRSGAVPRARECLEQAIEAGASGPRVREVLASLYRGARDFEPLADLLESEAAQAAEPAAAIAKLREAAELWATDLGQPGRAIPLLERATALDPADQPTRIALADMFKRAERYEEAKRVLGGIVADFGTRKPKERALVHLELARLSLAMGDRAAALTELDTASKIDPAHAGVLALMGEVSVEEGQLLRAQRTYRGLLMVLKSQQRRSGKDGDEHAGERDPAASRARVLVELAYVSELQKEADRKAEFVESAFEAAAQDPWEAQQLAVALDRRGLSDLVARALEQRLGADDLDEATRTDAELRLAEALVKQADRRADALDLAKRALGRAALDAGVRQRVRAVATSLGGLADFAAMLLDAADGIGGDPAAEALYREAAAVGEADLGDLGLVERALRGRLAALENAGAPIEEMRAALVEIDAVLVRRGDVGARTAVLSRIVELAGEDFESAREALYALAALRLDAADEEGVLELYERAARDDSDADRVEAALRAAVARLDGVRMPRLVEDFARERERPRALVDALVWIAERGDEPVSRYREAYEVAGPLGDEALSVSLLERLLAASGGDSEDVAWALSALAERRAAAGAHADAVALWERAARVSPPDEERALLLDVAARIARDLGDGARAAAIYEELRGRDPADREAWAPLAAIHQASGDVDALSKLLDEVLPVVDDLAERATLRMRLARMILEKQPDRAAELLAEAFEEAPQDRETGDLLAGLYERSGDKEKLAVLVERQLDAAKDAEDKARVVEVSMRLGALREALDDVDAALDVYHGALDWMPEHRDTLRAVVRLSMAREDSIGSGDLLERLLAVEEGDAAEALAVQMADIREAAGDPQGAERALFAGYKAAPRSKTLRDRLKKLYTERGSAGDLARLAAVEAGAEPDPKRRKARLVEAGNALRDEAQDAAGAADAFEAALALEPTDRDVLFAFMDAAATTGQHQRAITAVDQALALDQSDDGWLHFSRAVLREAVGQGDLALDDLETAHGQSGGGYHAELRAHLEAALSRVERDPGASRRSEREIRIKLAEVAAQGGDADAAGAALTPLLEKDPRDRGALIAMARVAELSQRLDEAMTMLERLASMEQGEGLVEVALRFGEVSRAAGRPDLATGALERALKENPTHAGLRTALRTAYQESGAIDELAELILADVEGAEHDAARFDLLVEAARVLLYGTGEASMGPEFAERSLAVIARARALKPDDLDTLLLEVDALGAMGRGVEARELVTQLIAAQRNRRSPQLGQAFYGLYRVESRDGNLTSALDALVKAFENQPQNAAVALELGQLASDLAQLDVAQRAFRAVTLMKGTEDAPVTGVERALAFYQLGRIAFEQGDARRAKLMLDRAVTEDAQQEEARALLAQIAAG